MGQVTLLTFSSSLIREDFWVFLSFPRSQHFQHILPESAKNTAIAEKIEENPQILTN